MKTKPMIEHELLHDVVRDDALREHVYAACVRELRDRAQAETTLLDELLEEGTGDFLETVRGDCLAALRPRSPGWILRCAQVAAVVLALALAGLLTRPSTTPAPPTIQVAQPPSTIPDYVVRSHPVADDILVRTGDHAPLVKHIDDDELLSTLPGLSIARTWDGEGNATVFVGQPAGRLYRIN